MATPLELCECAICKRRTDFAFPQQLLDAAKSGQVVVFAGAGISTEDKLVWPETFYESIAAELGVDPSSRRFPERMSAYCKQTDGRRNLLTRIHERFDYVASFPELYKQATAFHRELSTICTIQEIITTNWDDYFERECGAIPYVTDGDFALSGIPGRKVYKLHGSMTSLASIIATTEDYNRCHRDLNTGVIGARLKTILATKTIVYVGYSLGDEDFKKIHRTLTTRMKGLRPHSYLVTLDRDIEPLARSLNMTPIVTEGTHFLRVLKRHLAQDGILIPDEKFGGIPAVYVQAVSEHEKLSRISLKKHPGLLLTYCYQDGLIHALERMTARRKTGEYSHDHFIMHKLREYSEIMKARAKSGRYTDAAYAEGYMNGLQLLLTPDDDWGFLPMYYVFGSKKELRTTTELRQELPKAKGLH
jgi:NAD-dependent SIR2 family protein deacetylase